MDNPFEDWFKAQGCADNSRSRQMAEQRWMISFEKEIWDEAERKRIFSISVEESKQLIFESLTPAQQFTTLLWEKKTDAANKFLEKIDIGDFLQEFRQEELVILLGERLWWISEPHSNVFEHPVDVYELLFMACKKSPTFQYDKLSEFVSVYFATLKPDPWVRNVSSILKTHPELRDLL